MPLPPLIPTKPIDPLETIEEYIKRRSAIVINRHLNDQFGSVLNRHINIFDQSSFLNIFDEFKYVKMKIKKLKPFQHG